MRERSKDKMRLEHIAEAINRLQTDRLITNTDWKSWIKE